MSTGVNAIVQAETGIQIALLIPSSVAVCWLIGAWADKHFHQSWISIFGIVFGAITGLFYVFRMALHAEKGSPGEIRPQAAAGKEPNHQSK